MESRVAVLEQKIAGLEKQIAELQEKTTAPRPAPVAVQKLAPAAAPPASPSKPTASAEKQYHTVQKGESLSGIAAKYGISMEELRKLNNLPADSRFVSDRNSWFPDASDPSSVPPANSEKNGPRPLVNDGIWDRESRKTCW